jgi:type VI secretion system protein ImpC
MKFSSGQIDFELGTQTSFSPWKAREDTPFCIAVLADFGGRRNRNLCEKGSSLAGRRRIAVDVDNFEELPMKLGCEMQIPLGGKNVPQIALRFNQIDDFHPDRIFESLEIFQQLKQTRKLLQEPSTFAEGASQVRSWFANGEETGKSDVGSAEESPVQDESGAETIERLLGKRPKPEQHLVSSGKMVDIDALIREVVRPYIVPAPDPQQAELIAQVDQVLSGQMKAILHHPDFQELEANWRMLGFVISELETDETLKVYVLDVSKEELAADLSSADDLSSSGTYRLIAERSAGVPGAEQYALLLAGYTFEKTAQDTRLLRQLARVAQAAGAPILAAADSHYAGCPSLATTPDPQDWRWQADQGTDQLWQELRDSSEAAYVGLVLPRFLLRLPYGRDTDPVESFDFEEFSPYAGNEQYLWGNSAAICTYLLGMAFREFGWALTGGLGSYLTGIPMHIYESEGERRVTPCAETYLTERAMEQIIGKGLMPVISTKGEDAVQVPRFQSIADPPAPLAGPWR